MNYFKNLQQLRQAMVESSTKRPQPETSESFIPSRQTQAPQEDTQSLIERSAQWLSTIKQGTQNVKEQAPEVETGSSPLIKALGEALFSDKPTSKERKESFIKRRDTDSPSRYAPERPNEKAYKNILSDEASEVTSPGYGDLSQKRIESVIRQEAAARKIDPDVAVAIFRSEGAGSYQSQVKRQGKGSYGGKEDSYGPFQLYRGGGLGNEYEKLTGRNLRQDNTEEGVTNQIRFALDRAVTQGWSPWYGRKTAGVGVRQGLTNAVALGNWK